MMVFTMADQKEILLFSLTGEIAQHKMDQEGLR